MRLNDPFGRVSRKDRDAYSAIRERLRQAQITDSAGMAQIIRQTNRTALQLLLLLWGVTLIAALLLPPMRTLLALIAALLTLWLGANHLQTRMHLARYLREEC